MSIFMIGTQRSGSNLLRLMLNQLTEIAAPHPPHILQRLMPLVGRYGDLRVEASFAHLVEDVCRLVELNPVPWEGVVLDRRAVAARCRERSLVAVFGAVYDAVQQAWGAKAWCCKSLANVNYLNEIEAYFGVQGRYIYLYRDGRDVALSFRKAVVGEKHFYHIGKEWAAAQRLALAHRKRIGDERFFSLSYEQLTQQPEQTMRALCRFLGIAYSHAMLDFHRSDEAKRAASASELWGNVVNPVLKGNSNKFLQEVARDDIRVFELVAGDVLDTLGYRRECTKHGETTQFTAAEVQKFDAENRRIKQEVLSRVDPEDLKRRDQQAALVEAIRARAPSPDAMWVNV